MHYPLLRAALASSLFAFTAFASHAQSAYTFTDLGVTNPASPHCIGQGINNNGQIVAQSSGRLFRIAPTLDGAGNQVWSVDANNDGVNDLISVLPLPSGYTTYYTYPGSINASGQVSGVATGNTQAAVVWSAAGTPKVVTTSKLYGSALGLNDGGDVVGGAWPWNKTSTPYLWKFSAGSYTATQLSTAGGYGTAVNGFRQVLGPGFLWLPSAAYGLPQGMNALTGITVGSGRNLSNTGLVSGATPGGNLCVWSPVGAGSAYGLVNGLNDLGAFAPGTTVAAFGLTNPPTGQPLRVVGFAANASNVRRAFVWDSATRVLWDLNGLVVNLPAGWTLTEAHGINDLGQIVGQGTYNGATRGFVLTPNP